MNGSVYWSTFTTPMATDDRGLILYDLLNEARSLVVVFD